jgi:DnaK suppressor protein
MTSKQNLVREHLEQLKTSLLKAEESGVEAEQTVELDQSRVGRLSRMDAMQAQAMSKETGRRRRLQLRRIDEALRRLDDGSYGECQECGEEIHRGRLEFDPAVPLCIDCANLLET